MKRIGIVVLGLVCGCSSAPREHAAPFALDRAGRPSAQTGAVPLASGWFLAGSAPKDYNAGIAVDGSGSVSGTLASITPPGGQFGTVMTCVDATPLQGQRIALAATVGTSSVAGWAGLWMRVDGPGTDPNGSVTAFDNMQDRPIVGTSADAQYQVVLDVAANAVDVCYGLLLVDAGSAHFSQLTTRAVDHSVPTTDGGLGNGWYLAGNAPDRYQPTLSFDSSGAAQGSLASRDNSVTGDQFGTIATTIDAASRVGGKAELDAMVAPTNVTASGAALWVRVDDANGTTLAFDNMQNNLITGTAPAAPFSVIVDVPAGAASISYGILLGGSGRIDFSSLSLK